MFCVSLCLFGQKCVYLCKIVLSCKAIKGFELIIKQVPGEGLCMNCNSLYNIISDDNEEKSGGWDE